MYRNQIVSVLGSPMSADTLDEMDPRLAHQSFLDQTNVLPKLTGGFEPLVFSFLAEHKEDSVSKVGQWDELQVAQVPRTGVNTLHIEVTHDGEVLIRDLIWVIQHGKRELGIPLFTSLKPRNRAAG